MDTELVERYGVWVRALDAQDHPRVAAPAPTPSPAWSMSHLDVALDARRSRLVLRCPRDGAVLRLGARSEAAAAEEFAAAHLAFRCAARAAVGGSTDD